MRILELFGGIGACTKALKRLGLNPITVDYVEIDKYAVASYNAINGTDFKPQDICEWDKDIEVDLIMHGSPCQDFSVAGLQAGGDQNSGTRSSLMYESVRIIKKLMPKYVVWENVKNVLSAKHRHNFDKYLNTLEELGYQNFYQVLNAKDYGVPQDRERVFVISVLGGGEFKFPEKQELKLRLKDVLQDEVDEKFYINEKMTEKVLSQFEVKQDSIIGGMQKNQAVKNDGICTTLTASMGTGGGYVPMTTELRCVQVGQMYGTEREPNPQAGRIYYSEGLSPTLDSCSGGNRMPKIVEEIEQLSETSYCIDANYHKGTSVEQFLEKKRRQLVTTNMRIRKLTPLECWRLMGFDDEDFYKAEKVNSNTQLYKQAGNSIVVNVLEHIFKEMLMKEEKWIKHLKK